jgi:phosphate starvation-inducible PhoH-like protein
MQERRKTRKEKSQEGSGRVVKEKFLEQRKEAVKSRPLVPMNKKQQHYIELLNEKPVVVATGLAGTSKTYVATVMAADLYKLNQIQKIIITRPAISSSKSVGYTSGDFTQKMMMWLGSVIPILKERLGQAALDLAISTQDIEFVPLETVKGLSLNDTWLLVEESSDLTKEEVIKLVTRMGKNSKLVLSGDIRQSELREESGLVWLTNFISRHPHLSKNFGHIDFDSTDDIVRSSAVKDFIICLMRDEKKGIR